MNCSRRTRWKIPAGFAMLSAGVLMAHASSFVGPPYAFESNAGQTAAAVKFLSRGPGYTLFLTRHEAVLSMQRKGEHTSLRLRPVGANPAARISGIDPLPGRSHYFLGNNSADWRRNIPAYSRVKYRGVYPGIDLIYYVRGERLEYDFVVAPGADPNRIRLRFGGARNIKRSPQGDLVMSAGGGEFRHHRPRVYQEINGSRNAVAASYMLSGNHEVSFRLGPYDRRAPLIIDPVLSYASYLGGSGVDIGRAIAIDKAGNIYVTGTTESPNFPTRDGALRGTPPAALLPEHVFVSKFDPTGTALIYSTYIGGNVSDRGNAIAVDGDGNAYIAGSTLSQNFPTTAGAIQRFYNSGNTSLGSGSTGDGFVAKLDPTGSNLVYSTYFGGEDVDRILAIAVDAAGNAYFTGQTASDDFRTTQGAYRRTPCSARITSRDFLSASGDAFVSKLNTSGTALLYSTFLCGSFSDIGNAIAIDSQGAAYVAGQTFSTDFPTTTGALQTTGGGEFEDAFVAKLNPDGSALAFSTYLGGTHSDVARGIALDAQTNVYVTGTTLSTDFPVKTGALSAINANGGAYESAFVTKLNPTGSVIVYSTYLGASGTDRAAAITVDRAGNAYVTGSTSSSNFPVTAGKCQTAYAGKDDVFVTKINASGTAIVYSAVLGGSGEDRGNGIALDLSGNAWVTGQTVSGDFPTSQDALYGAYAHGYRGASDAFVARIEDRPSLVEPCIPATGVRNAASFLPGPVAPGEIITIFGAGLGPAALAGLTLDSSGAVSRVLAETRVLVDGNPVPILYTRSDQLSAIIPYSVAGNAAANIEVEFRGKKTASFAVNVDAAAPGLFTAANGVGQGAILNQNLSFNSAANPAARGDVVVLYATGEGQTQPTGMEGAVTGSAPPKPLLPVKVRIGGVDAVVQYAGEAPGLVTGVLQVNAVVPAAVRPGSQVPVILMLGNFSSQFGVSMAVK